MPVHSIRVFVLGPIVLVVLAISFAISAIVRRRRLARLRAMQTPRPAVVPVASFPRRHTPMRRFIWGIVIGAIVLAAVTRGVTHVQTFPTPIVYTSDSTSNWDGEPVEPPAAVVRQPEVRPAVPARKQKFWARMSKPAPVEPPHQWRGEIERGCLAAEAESPEAKLKALRDGLVQQLNLRVAPPSWFFSSEIPVFFRIDETKTEPIKHDPVIGDYVRIRYEVEVTPLGWQELSRLERADRSGERMEDAARGLGLLTVLLGAVTAFLRLDDWTKGYYSGRLFLASAALVAALGYVILRPM